MMTPIKKIVIHAPHLAPSSAIEPIPDTSSVTFPSVPKMIKGALEAGVILAKYGKESRSEDEIKTVSSICNSCDKYNQSQNRCSLCGCFLSIKTKYKAWHCPIGKW